MKPLRHTEEFSTFTPVPAPKTELRQVWTKVDGRLVRSFVKA